MKSHLTLTAIFCLLILTCCHQGIKPPENYQAEVCNELNRLDKLFFEAWDNENLDSCMAFLDDSFINMFSSGHSLNLQESRDSYKNFFDSYIIEGVKYDQIECFADQDFAFEIGHFEQTLISNDGKDTIQGKVRAISVFKKQEDGRWKQFRLIGQQ